MRERSTAANVATAALVVSIVSAAFSIFQWLNSERESRIAVAVDISRNYLKERDQNASALVLKAVTGGADSISQTELEAIGRYSDLLSYIALLANNNRLDKAYLADTVACDIFYANKAIGILKKYFEKQDPEMLRFIRANPCTAELSLPASN